MDKSEMIDHHGKENNVPPLVKSYPKRNSKSQSNERKWESNADEQSDKGIMDNERAIKVRRLDRKFTVKGKEDDCKKVGKEASSQSSKKKGMNTKAQLLGENYPAVTNENVRPKRYQPKTVDKLFKKMNIEPDRVSSCLKAAMCKGCIKITGDMSDLQQVVIQGDYEDHDFKVLVKDILYQPDYGGNDYDDGLEEATVCCICCKEYQCRAYVTRICEGNPAFDSGKFHNHCTKCRGFGKCIGDYREDHCGTCNKHWFRGLSGFPCSNCEQAKQQQQGWNMEYGDESDEYDDGGWYFM